MRDRKFTPNDNGSVIRMLSGKYAECNRGRNRILLGAVILSIVTLTMVFDISYGRIRGEELRAIRQAGTAASGMIPYADSSQYAQVRSLEYISEAGRSVTVGEAREADAQTAGEKSETENPEQRKRQKTPGRFALSGGWTGMHGKRWRLRPIRRSGAPIRNRSRRSCFRSGL